MTCTPFSDEEIARAVTLRRHFHRHPELEFAEHATARRVAEELEPLGYRVRTGIAGTGVVADLEGVGPGPRVALRADMDALPIAEQGELEYRSAHPGVMHACGHDGHTASLLLAAGRLASEMRTLPGSLRLIFQPAEETGQGAKRMIEAGALDGVDAIFAYHNRPGLRQGDVALRAGPTCGGGTRYRLILHAQGGHAARPHLVVDPVYLATLLVQSWQGVVSRAISPLASGLLSVTRIDAGDSANLGSIPSRCEIFLGLRYDTPATRDVMIARLEALTRGICDAWGASYSLEASPSTPAAINDPEVTHRVATALASALPAGRFQRLEALPTLGGEDFAFYLERVPGCLFFVGAGVAHADLHSERYDYPDEILPVAAHAFVTIVRALLAR